MKRRETWPAGRWWWRHGGEAPEQPEPAEPTEPAEPAKTAEAPAPPSPGLTREHYLWAYRLFLDREPEPDLALDLERGWPDTATLRQVMQSSEEFQRKNPHFRIHDRFVVAEVPAGFKISLKLSDFAIGVPIFYGSFEPHETAFVRATVQPGQVVLDIGANIGYYTLLMATLVGPEGRVHSFEPLEFLHAELVKSIAENRFEERCVASRVALSQANGEIRIRHAPRTINLGGGHIASGATPPGHLDELCRTGRLDDDEALREARVSFVKMDVEGAEPLVVEGGSALLARSHPTILSELHNLQLKRVSGRSANDYIAMMRARGYECRSIGAGGPGEALPSYEREELINVVFRPAQ